MLYAHNVGTLNHILKILKVSKNDHERSIIKNAPDGSKDPSGASFLRTFSLFQLQEELDEREYNVSAGGGAVGIKINGKRRILSIDIKPEIVDPDDIETLSDILVAAVNEAITRVDDTNAAEMAKVTGSMNMPGLF